MGLLSTIGAASGRAFGLTRVGAAIRDAYFNLTTLLLPGDGTNGAQNNTFLDSSTNNFTITRNGNTTQGTFSPFSQTGWSNFFNGSSDFLNIGTGYPSALDLGSSNFTIEGWVYLQAATKQLMLGNLNDTNGTCTFFVMLNNTTASARYEIKLGSTAYNLGTGTIPTNQWVHVCLMRSGTSVYLFENGAQIGTTQTYSGSITSSTNQMRVGGAVAGQHPFSGYASNLRMVIGSVVYSTSGFTVPTTPLTAITNTAMLICQSNRFFDASANAISITTSGTPSVQAFSPFAPTAAYSAATVGGSGYFDGTGDYLSVPDDVAFTMGAGDFALEAWVYVTATSGSQVIFGTSNSAGSAGSMSFVLQAQNSSGFPAVVVGYAGALYSATSSEALTKNQWNHIAGVRNGATVSIYVNGVSRGTLNMGTLAITDSTDIVGIGRNGNFNGEYLTGYIASARIVKGSAVYTADFTLPTAPLTAITNTQLLLNYTNAGITDATAKNVLETVGNAQISTTQSKFGGSSMYFDGTGDQLVFPNSENFNIVRGNFTVECWVYLTGSSGSIINYTNGQSNNSNFAFELYQISSSTIYMSIFETSTQYFASSTAFALNTWVHLAGVRNGNTLTVYVNGTAGSTTANVTGVGGNNPGSSTLKVSGYNNATNMITGYVDDLRITKGYARYTANFTPPTAPFALQ